MTARLALALLLALPVPAHACTFCDGSLRTKQTLRMHYAQSKVVVHGQLKNARFDPKTDDGFTDLHVGTVLKDNPVRANRNVLTLARYLPVVGNTPPDYLIFCGVANGALDPTHGVATPVGIVEYLRAASALDDADAAKKLGFFFKHLDSADATIAADAFTEFARAADADILKAAKQFDSAKVRKLIADPATPVERLGVFAFLLGTTGTQTDADFLGGMLKQSPLPERASAAFGGLLAGYILLAPKDGWEFAAAVLGDAKRSYADRLSTLGTVRFLQATRPEFKPDVLKCCAALLPHGDLADQAIEDLRRWGWWDLSADVFALFGKPGHAAPIVRRAIVRHALSCPKPEAKIFLDAARAADAKLVKSVEDMMSLYDPVPPSKPKP